MTEQIIGKRTILFQLDTVDLDHFVKVHREDRNGYMCKFCLKEMTELEAKKYILSLLIAKQIFVFTVMTKEGKASKRAGYIYLSDFNKYSTSIAGIMDKDFAKGLNKVMRRGKYTFAEDSFRTLIQYCFEILKLQRVELDIIENNRIAIALANKIGFVREGIKRKSFIIDGVPKNLVFYSMLREEWKNG